MIHTRIHTDSFIQSINFFVHWLLKKPTTEFKTVGKRFFSLRNSIYIAPNSDFFFTISVISDCQVITKDRPPIKQPRIKGKAISKTYISLHFMSLRFSTFSNWLSSASREDLPVYMLVSRFICLMVSYRLKLFIHNV